MIRQSSANWMISLVFREDQAFPDGLKGCWRQEQLTHSTIDRFDT
ncbi:hypothetical protein Q644_02085 [Brucella intermedia 229E]|uniref:Uncharacterized protein n=2 Tax=Brucella intermedia TaxID=94625 RepID=U4VDS2_9HYPH|nr:hypothetical protein Q644_02085 [Brucella intermedia 229E]